MVVDYSRLLWLHFYPQQTMAVLTEALESTFEAFGGVPKELGAQTCILRHSHHVRNMLRTSDKKKRVDKLKLERTSAKIRQPVAAGNERTTRLAVKEPALMVPWQACM